MADRDTHFEDLKKTILSETNAIMQKRAIVPKSIEQARDDYLEGRRIWTRTILYGPNLTHQEQKLHEEARQTIERFAEMPWMREYKDAQNQAKSLSQTIGEQMQNSYLRFMRAKARLAIAKMHAKGLSIRQIDEAIRNRKPVKTKTSPALMKIKFIKGRPVLRLCAVKAKRK